MRNSLLKSVLVSCFGKAPAQRGSWIRVAVNLFVQDNDKRITAETVVLNDTSVERECGLRALNHKYDLSCTEDFNLVVIGYP